ncbi:MAG: hypothetical protein HYX66_05370 [Ignavibacteria bacterium]|nr:hypothetical protein [Ignavibacteria bacterium]
MNVVRIIFALYVLFLALNPCSDSSTYIDVGSTNIATNVNAEQYSTNATDDLCTPFCICACCSTHIQLNQVADISFAVAIHVRLAAPTCLDKPLIGNGNSVWKPPKFS